MVGITKRSTKVSRNFRQLFATSGEFARRLCGYLGEQIGHTIAEIGGAEIDF